MNTLVRSILYFMIIKTGSGTLTEFTSTLAKTVLCSQASLSLLCSQSSLLFSNEQLENSQTKKLSQLCSFPNTLNYISSYIISLLVK